jgi:putative hydrolase of the HAD superfamily
MELMRGVVFDLDDTLYFERNYVLSGFRFIAEVIGGDGGGSEQVFSFLSQEFEDGVRGNAFDRVIAKYPELEARWKTADLVDLYRSHSPTIALEAAMSALVAGLVSHGIPIALITDGPIETQSRKIESLGIRDLFSPIILTDAWGIEFRKPHARAFQAVMEAWRMKPTELAYIGDNPVKDFRAPRALGWQTARLRMKQQLRYALEAASPEFAPHREFGAFEDLSKWISEACALPAEKVEVERVWQHK